MTTEMKSGSKKRDKLLPDGPDWTFDLLECYHTEIKRVAEHYRLDTYPNQIEIITSEQMMDAYSSIGMPINYNHWSFGKSSYKQNKVINTDKWGWLMKLSLILTPVLPI